MKKILLLFTLLSFSLSFSQTHFDYKTHWEKIDMLNRNKGQAKQLLPLVEEIYNHAEKEDNYAQKYKAMMYQSTIVLSVSSMTAAEAPIIKNLQQEIKTTTGVNQSFARVLLANIYKEYYGLNRFKIEKRTAIEGSDDSGEEIEFWTERQFKNQLTKLYFSALKPVDELQHTSMESWSVLLQGDQNTAYLKPSTYDFIASEYLHFLNNSQWHFPKEEAKEQSTLIYKSLIALHQKDTAKNALAYNKLQFLDYQKKELSEEAYEKKLVALAAEFDHIKYSSYLYMKLADYYYTKFNQTSRKAFAQRKTLAEKSLKYARKITEKFKDSDENPLAEKLIQNLTFPKIELSMEYYLIPDEYTPIQLTYKNTHRVYFKIYHLSETQKKQWQEIRYKKTSEQKKEMTDFFKTLALSKSFNVDLKAFNDYQNRTTTLRFPKLNPGQYLVAVSDDPHFDFNRKKTEFLYNIINVSPYVLSYQNGVLLLTNRKTGQPIKRKGVNVFQTKNDQRTFLNNIKTDAEGMADYKVDNAQQIQFRVDGDSVYFDRSRSYYSQNSEPELLKKTKLFTDRKIYRPGQTLYFKGVAYLQKKNDNRHVKPKQNLHIKLYDVNGSLVAQKELTTNDFGSVSGSFMLPSSGLTGRYYLTSSFDEDQSYPERYYFNVEEYKRPKFKITFDDIDSVFRLNQKIKTTGQAESYAGSAISQAKVTYRVFRRANYPYWPIWRGPRPYAEQEEITQGETTTDAQGRFTIDFVAKPNENEDFPNHMPKVFTYQVEASITDINGETHQEKQSVSVGERRYVLNIPLAEKINLGELDSIPIQTKNLNGKTVTAQGNLTIEKLKAPNRVLRDSPLGKTDYELYPKEEFVSYFPHEAYANEDKTENWKPGKTVLNKNFDTKNLKAIRPSAKNWETGYYRLKAYILDGQDSVKVEQVLYLYHPKLKKPVDHQLFTINLDKTEYTPGDKAEVQIASSAKNSRVFVALEVDGKIVKQKNIRLNNGVRKFKFPIKESYRGDVFVHYYFGKYNTSESGTLRVDVPYKKHQLKIKTSTFRNKLKPGEKETWTLHVSGQKEDQVAAEVLATMYDQSLDQFYANTNTFNLYNYRHYSSIEDWRTGNSMGLGTFNALFYQSNRYYFRPMSFGRLNLFGNEVSSYLSGRVAGIVVGKDSSSDEMVTFRGIVSANEETYPVSTKAVATVEAEDIESSETEEAQMRRNLEETAFFYPNLKTDASGAVKLEFTSPESLTQWKFMATAHTKDMQTGYLQKSVVTQKELMIMPNPPRFLREGDTLNFSAKISNLSTKNLQGEAVLKFFDAFTMQPIDADFQLQKSKQSFQVDKNGNTVVTWSLVVPKNRQAVVYHITASTDQFSDGEENALPILTNRKLVTETLPLFVKEGEDKTFTLEKLKNNSSKTLKNFKLTFEMTENPIWYAVFSLPYLRQPTYDNSIADFGWVYGNMISQKIIADNPKIKAVFDDWRKKGDLTSKLNQNEDLKELLLSETPWVKDAESEEEQMKQMANLFDQNKLQNELKEALKRLFQKQSEQGGFPWFDGGNDNRAVSTYILAGFGHLKALGINLDDDYGTISRLEDVIKYLDNKAIQEYQRKHDNDKYQLDLYGALYYLYARSMFKNEVPIPGKAQNLKDDILAYLIKHKFEIPLHSQALTAMVFEQYGRHDQAVNLLKSVKDHAVESEADGMYWKSNIAGWRWEEAPILTQALLIEAFDEILEDENSVEEMKVWLLKNRQTHQWKSVKATTEAVYALLNTGKDWLNSEGGISVKIGGRLLDFDHSDNEVQTGSGYVKAAWHQTEIKPEMAEVEVHKTDPGISWGALYWQYFEDLDQITSAKTGIKIEKELYLKKNTAQGPELQKITPETPIKVGDLVSVRLKIKTDRDMQFVHLKDMRASGFEPINVISKYRYQDGLFYYESTRDAATNFFMDRMPKGAYVFEYEMRANNSGQYSNGITTLQNMYVPELSAHSKGIRVTIE